jgi:hypothetical protein
MTQANYELLETFENNSSELYWLAFLLTGNTDRGVQAFDKALDFVGDENPAFDGFISEWARKLVIVEALGTVKQELRASKKNTARLAQDEGQPASGEWSRLTAPKSGIERGAFEQAVIAIDALPRCAMLLTIFERMTVAAAATLLNVDEALTRVAQRIGIVQLTRNLSGNDGRNARPEPRRNPVPVLSFN